MHPAAGIIVGIILVVVGLALFFVPQLQPWGISWFWVHSLITVVTGAIPLLLILAGLFFVWLQADELKSNKEVEKTEEVKEKPVKPARKPKKQKAQ